jgi:gamma-glutamyltranspeptidase/glutathione hydrolase
VLAPGKRMNSTQSPTLVTRDGQLILAVGSPGNYRIISTVTQVLVNYLDFQMPIQDAINAPRLSARFDDPKLSVEGDFPAATLDALRAHGHDLAVKGTVDLFFGGVHAIHRDPATGMLTGAADPRRDGVAKGLRAVPKPAAAPTSTPAPQESAQ